MEDVCAVGDTYDRYWNWIPSCSSRSVTNKNAFATVLFPAVSMSMSLANSRALEDPRNALEIVVAPAEILGPPQPRRRIGSGRKVEPQ